MKKRKVAPQSKPTLGGKLKPWFTYAYLVAFFMLLSGFFHPLITGTSGQPVVIGVLVLTMGLVGAILLYKAAGAEFRVALYAGLGLGLVSLSLFLIFILAGRV